MLFSSCWLLGWLCLCVDVVVGVWCLVWLLLVFGVVLLDAVWLLLCVFGCMFV